MHSPLDRIDDTDATTTDFLFGGEGPQRQLVSEAQLHEYLSALIRGYEGCEGVSVIETTRLDRPDEGGCNWSSSLVLDPAGVAPETYALAYASVIAVARAGWNLEQV
jgi:hypothetical protein